MHIFHSVFHNEEDQVEQQQKKKEDDCWKRAYVRVKAPFLHSLPVYCVDIRSPDDTTTTPDTRLATPPLLPGVVVIPLSYFTMCTGSMDGGRGLTSKRLFASHRTSTPPRQLLCIISDVVPLYLDALNVIKFKFVLLLHHYFFLSPYLYSVPDRIVYKQFTSKNYGFRCSTRHHVLHNRISPIITFATPTCVGSDEQEAEAAAEETATEELLDDNV